MKGCEIFEGGDQAPNQVAKAGDESCTAKPTHNDERNKTTERYSSFVNNPRLAGGLFKAKKRLCSQQDAAVFSYNSGSNPTKTSDLCDVFIGEDDILEKLQKGPHLEKAPKKVDDDASARENESDEENSANLLVEVLDSINSDIEKIAPTPESEIKHNSRVTIESTSRLSEGNMRIVRVVTGIVIVVLFGVYFTRFLWKGSWFHKA